MNTSTPGLPQHVRVATYDTNQSVARYRGNKLIEAIPSPAGNGGLGPADGNVLLAHMVDSMLREGYVERPIASGQRRPSRRDYQTTHDQKETGPHAAPPHAFIAPSKASRESLERTLSHLAPVYYHRKFGLFQLTYLRVTLTPTVGDIKSIAQEIIQLADGLIPNGNYYETYVANRRLTTDALVQVAAHLMSTHRLGLLVVDVSQLSGSSNDQKAKLMSEVDSLCTRSGVPRLYFGAESTKRLTRLSFRGSRREY